MQCGNNLKQLGLSLLNYESTHKKFPIGFRDTLQTGNMLYDGGWSWVSSVLPFMEQTALYNNLDTRFHPMALAATRLVRIWRLWLSLYRPCAAPRTSRL